MIYEEKNLHAFCSPLSRSGTFFASKTFTYFSQICMLFARKNYKYFSKRGSLFRHKNVIYFSKRVRFLYPKNVILFKKMYAKYMQKNVLLWKNRYAKYKQKLVLRLKKMYAKYTQNVQTAYIFSKVVCVHFAYLALSILEFFYPNILILNKKSLTCELTVLGHLNHSNM